MAQIELRISSKVQKETGMCEVLIRFFQGSKFNLRAKSGVFVSPEYFEYYIDRPKTESLGVKVPGNLLTITEDKAKRAIMHSGKVASSLSSNVWRHLK